MPADPIPSETLRARLGTEHAQIEELLVQLIDAFDSGDRDIATTAFTAFERRLSEHLALEDELLLPEFARFDAAEAEDLAAEHRIIRQRVEELGIADNLHMSRANAIRELVDMLRGHAHREDVGLYAWADRSVDDRIFQSHERSPAPPAT